MKEAERNARRELSRKNKKNKEDVKLLKALKSRKIKSMDFQLEKINVDYIISIFDSEPVKWP